MGAIQQKMTLVDKVSPALNDIQKQALENIKRWEQLDKQLKDLDKTEQKLWEQGMKGSQLYKDLEMATSNIVNEMNALESGEVKVAEAQEEVNETTQATTKSLTELNQTLELASKAWNTVKRATREAYKWMEKYNVQFNAEFTAATKMHNNLGAGSSDIQGLFGYASELQKKGVVGDEAIIGGMSALAMYTDTTEQVKKLTPAILNLAVAENGLNTNQSNVASTATMVGRALNGQAMMIKRQLALSDAEVKKLDSMADKTEKANYLFELMTKRVGEANEMLAQTSQGGIMQANNALGDLQERLGKQVVPYFELFKKVLVDLLTPVVEFVEANANWLIPTLLVLAGIVAGLIVVTTLQTIATKLFGGSLVTLLPKIWAVAWPLLVIIGALYAAIQVMNEIMGTEGTLLGVTIGIIYMIKAWIQNLFIGLGIWLDTAKLGFVVFGETVMKILTKIAQAWDFIFGTDSASGFQRVVDNLEKTKNDLLNNIDNTTFVDWQAEARKGLELGNSISKSITEGVGLDLEALTTTDTTGAPALNTTSKDNLLKDEDIQLLLDAATRDFKLEYQQITPEIAITFGDVHETADVENITERIVEELTEAVNSDLGMVMG